MFNKTGLYHVTINPNASSLETGFFTTVSYMCKSVSSGRSKGASSNGRSSERVKYVSSHIQQLHW